ncbi:MAG: 6-hydroxynicotinate reductase [Rhodobacteraceae bacterium]|nr:6-hydroxynicotinate reductase [Paracoccaceae bacterium]
MTGDTRIRPEDKIRCDACPVLCYIAEGRAGACDRYANRGGRLVRLDPLTVIEASAARGGAAVPFLDGSAGGGEWDGDILRAGRPFVTAVGAGTTYPDYKPAPFIVSQQVDGVDMVTVVTEGIFSYCGAKVKIDTDRHIGPERAQVRVDGEPIGHVMTGEYGSRMLSLGGVEHLTGGTKKEGRVTCDALLRLLNREPVEMTVDEGETLVLQAGRAPVIGGQEERLMRVGCGSATIGMFAAEWVGHADEVVVVDDHITGVLSEHQAGRMLDVPPTGIRIAGHRSTPGRYFRVARPGPGWGGTDITDPLTILKPFDPRVAWPGLRLLMISTTGEQWAYYELDESLVPRPAEAPDALSASAAKIGENCEPSLTSVLFMGGAGGSLRAGVTTNPVRLTRSVRQSLTRVTVGGAEAYVWPGGGITIMADVTAMPSNAFGHVPTPALVAPIEFTLRLADYAALGGHMAQVRRLEDVLATGVRRVGPGGAP